MAGSPVNGTVASDVISGIHLTAGSNLTGYNFGELAGSLSGIVFVDVNKNGSYDSGDTPLSGVKITISGSDANNSAFSKMVNSSADGTYSLTGIPASDSAGYILNEASTSTYGQGTSVAGNPVNGGGGGDTFGGIHFVAGAKLVGYTFGEIGGSITGTVYADVNVNGQYDSSVDTLKSGIQITLNGTDSTGAAVSKSTTTASDGTYRFTSLPAGSYSIAMVPAAQPAGEWPTNPLQMSAGGQLTENFGVAASTLRGIVYLDINGNGQYDSGTDSRWAASISRLQGTDSTGHDRLQERHHGGRRQLLLQRTYDQQLDRLHDYRDCDVDLRRRHRHARLSGQRHGRGQYDRGIQFVANGSLAGYNFGEIPALLSGRVYTDVNSNGQYDSGTDTALSASRSRLAAPTPTAPKSPKPL